MADTAEPSAQTNSSGDGPADATGAPAKIKTEKEIQKEKKRLEKLAKFEAKKKKKVEEDAQKASKGENEVNKTLVWFSCLQLCWCSISVTIQQASSELPSLSAHKRTCKGLFGSTPKRKKLCMLCEQPIRTTLLG